MAVSERPWHEMTEAEREEEVEAERERFAALDGVRVPRPSERGRPGKVTRVRPLTWLEQWESRSRRYVGFAAAKARVAWRIGDPCAYCCGPSRVWDHITPVAAFGSHDDENLVRACRVCNSRKGDKSLLLFLVQQAHRRETRGLSQNA